MRHDAPRVAHQGRKQLVLDWREVDLATGDADEALGEVDAKVADFDGRFVSVRSGARGLAQPNADTSEQLGVGERFRKAMLPPEYCIRTRATEWCCATE